MEALITAFPENISEAIEIAKNAKIRKTDQVIENILICGMGGSGIGGRLVSKWLENDLKIPVYITSDYLIPGFVSEKTLVIGSSYSGNTEETLDAIKKAVSKGASLIAVCSGGQLEEYCKENGFDSIIVPGGNPPRTALAFSIVQLIQIFKKLELTETDFISQIESARKLIVQQQEQIKKQARELAEFLRGNVGILYGTTAYEPVLIRARQQFNENSKLLCWHHALPEMNHNELVGWGGGDDRFAVVFFECEDMHRRNAKRMEITKSVIAKKTSKVMTLKSTGENRIERSIYLINVVDWASLYLSELDGIDPIEIEVIDYLKGTLANFK